jgi:uncharacterized coiled-coil protein SlyX
MDVRAFETNIDDAVEAMLKTSDEGGLEVLPDDEEEEAGEPKVVETEGEDEGDEDSNADEGEESDDVDESDEDEDEDDGEKPSESKLADPDSEVEITVDGKATRVPVKDLVRLAGQEKALTQKSQALAEQRKITDRNGLLAMQTLQRQIERAHKRADQFKDVDLALAATQLSPEDYKALKEEMTAARSDVEFFENEAGNLLTTYDTNKKATLKAQAVEAVRAITDETSRFHIKDWNDTVYNEVLTYGVGQGLDRDGLKELVDPAAIKLIHKAMLFDRAKAKVNSSVKAKLVKAPKRALSKSDTASTTPQSRTLNKLLMAAKSSGNIDDVTAAFLAASKE